MPNSRDVSTEDLVSAASDRYPVRVRRDHKWWADDVLGFVTSVGKEWVVVQRLMGSVYFDGYELLRLKDITDVEDERDNGYLERALSTLGHPRVDFDLPKSARTRDVLEHAAEYSSLVSVYVEKTDEHALLIGLSARCRSKKFQMQLINREGIWTTDTSSWRFKDVTRVAIGGRYVAALERFGDARPDLESIPTE
ncbi:MAG: hypothetical protein H7288_20735 [Kineosporiaceae bacterium]|nr:hypothetical protein [Aeromicrobium sp.]